MKQIDTRFPIFAQLEVGDTIYTIDVNDKLIMAHRIVSVTDNSIEYKSDMICGEFNYYAKTIMLSSSFIDDRGNGWATSREAAVEGVHKFFDEKIIHTNKLIADAELKINKLQKQKEVFTNIKKQF